MVSVSSLYLIMWKTNGSLLTLRVNSHWALNISVTVVDVMNKNPVGILNSERKVIWKDPLF